MSPRTYEIRLKDTTLVTFSIVDDVLGSVYQIDGYDEALMNLMPLGLQLTGDGILRWLERRAIPSNRRRADAVCKALGFAVGDTESVYRVGLGLSLNDAYWVVPAGSDIRFADVTPYLNAFSEPLSFIALGLSRSHPVKGLTPELTTDGTLCKAWRIIDGKRVLVKGATDGYRPGEPFSEVIASSIGRRMGLDCVRYGYLKEEGSTYSTCENFTTMDVSYVPFAVATGLTNLPDALAFVYSMGDDVLTAFRNMLAFDCLTCNTDRHFANFGFLRSNATGELLALAPVFDNGRSLFPNSCGTTGDFVREAHMCRPSFGASTFEELFTRVAGPVQRDMIARCPSMTDIAFPSEIGQRAVSLNAFLRKRVTELNDTACTDEHVFMDAVHSAAEWLASRRRARDKIAPFTRAPMPLVHDLGTTEQRQHARQTFEQSDGGR